MEAQRALNALEQYIALARTTTSSRAAIDTITKATSDPNTYVFAELLHQPAIQSLRGTEHATYLTHLEIFAWGTWEDYNSTPNLPPLNEAQSHKLRLLTLITILTQDTSNVAQSYSYLLPRLSLSSPAHLEKLVQSAIYSSLVKGHIDPLHSRLAISSVSPLRDLQPNSLPRMTNILSAWDTKCEETLSEIETEIENVKAAAKANAERNRRRDARFEETVAKAEVKKNVWDAQGPTGDAMDLDGAAGNANRLKRRIGRVKGGKI